MQKNNRGLTVAARRRQRETGETYMQALAAVKPPRLNRDPADATSAMTTMGFAQLMAAGAKARAFPTVYPGGAGAVVREAVTTLWPQVTAGAVADVLAACASWIVSRGGPADVLNGWGDCPVATEMLNITAASAAAGRTASPGALLTPPLTLASSLAADHEREADVLHGTWVLLALAHQRSDEDLAADADGGEDDDWDTVCGECGGELRGQGTYGCSCWNPTACGECGDEFGHCDCHDF
jgi:hypothetical protein